MPLERIGAAAHRSLDGFRRALRASASRRSSTRSSRARCARPVTSTRSPAAAATPPRPPCRCATAATAATAGSSTPPASGPSDSGTSTPRTSSRAFTELARDRRRVPARLHPPPRRTGLRDRRSRRRGPTRAERRGAAGLAPAAAADLRRHALSRACGFRYRWSDELSRAWNPEPPPPISPCSTRTRTPVSLSDLRGHGVVLFFYPEAMTPGCTTEACDFRDSLAPLQARRLHRARHLARPAREAAASSASATG